MKLRKSIRLILASCISLSLAHAAESSNQTEQSQEIVSNQNSLYQSSNLVLDSQETFSSDQIKRLPNVSRFHNIITDFLTVRRTLISNGDTFINGPLYIGGVPVTGAGLSGNVTGPASSTPSAVAIYADNTGKVLSNSSVLVDPSGNVTFNGITKNGNTVSWPSTVGVAGTFLESDGAGNLVYGTPVGSGNVSTASPFATNNAVLTTDTPSGAENIKQTGVSIDGSNNMSGVNTLNANTVNSPTLNGNATSATTAGSFTGPLAGDVTGIQSATVVSFVNGQSALAVGNAAAAVAAATPNNTANTLVQRDASGNFSAGTITANLTGNVTGNLSGNAATATFATTAGSAGSFTGNLAGDVTGPQAATVVAFVGGQSAAQVASGVVAANAATNANTPNTIVLRDGSGNFNAGTITANLTGNVTGNLNGNATSATTAVSATNFTGSLSGDVTGNQNSTVVSSVGGQTAAVVASGSAAAFAATSANTPSTIVKRDGSGNFSAGTITASLNGNASTATSATTAGSATNFTGALLGDVTGVQSATVVSLVGGKTAAQVATTVDTVNSATTGNVANTLVLRDASGNFSAGTITANLTGTATFALAAANSGTFTGQLAGDVTGPQNATVVAFVGGQSAAQVASGVVAANAATNANTPNTIVLRDGSGNFNAGTITASLIGNVSGNLTGTATFANNATNATNFTGPLTGDVTGNQSSTVVSSVGGQTASAVAAATVLANAATSADTVGAIVRRDGTGSFTATNITSTGNFIGNLIGNVSGNATTATFATTAGSATNFTGALSGDVTGNQSTTVVATVGGKTAAQIATTVNTVSTATSNDVANTLVLRDASKNFTTNMITIDGTVTNPTDVATKAYVDSVASTGLQAKTPAVVVSTTDVPLSGNQTIDGVTLAPNDRVLLVGQTNPVQNGLWLDQVGAWTRPTDFSSGTTAGTAYVLTTSGVVNAGSSWLCTTTAAIIDTNPIFFAEFSLPNQTTGANVGTGAGQIFRDKTGVTLNFKTLAASSHVTVINNTNDVTLGTDATSTNSANNLVARDQNGVFAGTLTGSATLNVLKTGDTMTGTLNMANQTSVRFQDAGAGNFVGINGPATIGSSYTVNLPSAAPTTGQILQALTPTSLQWATSGGSPTATETYYVSLAGSDSNDGSFGAPFRTISHAVTVANAVATTNHPIVINVGAGIFIENNSGGPINITADGINIIGTASTSTIIVPASLSNNLFNCTTSNVFFTQLALQGGVGSTAVGISMSAGTGIGGFRSILVGGFLTGISISGIPTTLMAIANIISIANGTGVTINNAHITIEGAAFLGVLNGVTTPAHTALTVTGTTALATLYGNSFKLLSTGISATNGSDVRLLGSNFESTTSSVVCSGGSKIDIIGSNFIVNNSNSFNITGTGSNSTININSCSFDGTDTTGAAQGTAILAANGASINIEGCGIQSVVVGIQAGTLSGNNGLTQIQANSTTLSNCTSDIIQVAGAALKFVGGIFDTAKTTIGSPTNVNFAAFDDAANDALTLGNDNDQTQRLYQILNGQSSLPFASYEPNYYGSKGILYQNPNNNPSFHGVQAQSNGAYNFAVTGDNTKETGVNLISDTANIGIGDNVRGWSITKAGTSAELVFTYTNNDTSGQAARGSNAVMQLDGFDNQVEFPIATNSPLPTNTTAVLLWGGDTNLYRASANLLKTDDNFAVGTLNTVGVVHNDATGLLSTSLIVNADVSPTASIVDTKLATIQTAGKVANSATTATSSNTPNTIVLRDASGNFSAGTITANITGTATGNVLKTGDTMTGTLNMANETSIRFQDATGTGSYVGINAPLFIPSSYTVSLPATPPSAGQFLQSLTTTALQWANVGGSPTANETFYVALDGSDSNNGSFTTPFRTISHAVSVANGISSQANPIAIQVGAGLFGEDNTGGPINITADGISILGTSIASTEIYPLNPAGNLFNITTPFVNFENLALIIAFGSSTASAVNLSTGTFGTARFHKVAVGGYQTGFALTSNTGLSTVVFDGIQCAACSPIISINNMPTVIQNSLFTGPLTGGSTPSNTGVTITGTTAQVAILSNAMSLFNTAISVSGGSTMRVIGTDIEETTTGILCAGGSNNAIVGCNFLFNNSGSVNVSATGANTTVVMEGTNFHCGDSSGNSQGTAIQVTGAASLALDSCAIDHAVTAIRCGATGDTSTTSMKASGAVIADCTTDIVQKGSSSLNFFAGVFNPEKSTINDPTNVSFAAFDDEAILVIGTNDNVSHPVYEILNGQATVEPILTYEPHFFGGQGTVYQNRSSDAAFNATLAPSNNSSYYVITEDNTKAASVNLISETTNVGSGQNIRGWSISKTGTAAELVFTYSNNDTSGQAARGANNVMQLNGFDNQVEFPLATNSPLPTNMVAKLIWAGDTTLYRAAATLLKTDGSLAVGSLTPNRALVSDSNSLIVASVTTSTELSFVSGVTSSIQTQLNSKFTFTGGTLTGNLTIPAGSVTAPSLNFAGQTTTGLSANSNIFSISTTGSERMKIDASGNVFIDGFTSSGVVHNDATGLLSSSLIINADVSPTASIVDTKLATIATAGKVSNSATTATSSNVANAIVARDASGNFSAGTITASLTGAASLNVLKTGDTMTGTLFLPAGSTGFPSLQFSGSTDTGLSATSNNLSISTAGVGQVTITSTGVVFIPGGNAAVPALQFSGNQNTGLSASGNTLTVSTGGAQRMTIDSNGIVTVSAGSGTTPTIQFGGSTNTGFSAPTTNTLALSTNGAQQMTITSTGVVFVPAGSGTVPSLQFTGNQNTGLSASSNILGFSTAGTQQMTISSTGIITVPKGSIAIPSLQFAGSSNTGISSPSSNALSLSVSGTVGVNIDSSGNTTYRSNYKLYAYLNAAQGINTTTATVVFNTETLDPNNNYNTGTGVYTVPVSGVYLINVVITAQTAAQPSTQTVNIVRNGTAVTGASVSQVLSNNTARQPMTTCALLQLTAGDAIRVDVTTTKNDTVVANDSHIAIHFMSLF